jgi:hypothetical protein
MLQFKHPHDLKQLPEAHPAYPLIKDLGERLIVDFPPSRLSPNRKCPVVMKAPKTRDDPAPSSRAGQPALSAP